MAEGNLPTTGGELEEKNEFPATATEESQVTSSDAELDVYNDPLREIAKVCVEKGNKEYRQGEANNAINSYTEGLKVNCKDKRLNAKLYSNRATAHFRLANYVECLDDATVAVQLEPSLIKAIKKGARACAELCWYKEARSWLHMGLTIENNNESLLQLMRKSNAELRVKANTYASLGCTYYNVGQFNTAIVYLQQSMAEGNLPTTGGGELEEKNEFPATATEESQVTSSDAELDVYNDPLREIAKVCLEKGNKEYRQGEANKAINSYTEGLKVNCKDERLNAKLYSNRATAHFRLANYVECLDDATVAVQLEPTLIKAIKKGARACVELCWYKEARSWLHMGLTIENNNEHLLQLIRKSNAELKVEANTYASLGCTYHNVGQFNTAIVYFQQCLEISKELGDKAGEGRSYGSLGIAYHSLREFKTAIKNHQRRLEITKEIENNNKRLLQLLRKTNSELIVRANNSCHLSNNYQGLGKFKAAIKYHQRQLEIDKVVKDKNEEGRNYCNLGSTYQSLGQFKTAIHTINVIKKLRKKWQTRPERENVIAISALLIAV
ncbi:hypothetical protein pdam_00003736 [Pocillopora damicornis]|uniref:MalT-like TPR region domain-containing protein n=1 Tax=Pocillopora damicornis TaxID=46731 RepID=A0A3M6UEH9_POCDA|nr:hypothetical protein pdam_00003736 [Pocillopora damicornis]